MAMCNTYQVYGSRMGETTLDGTRTVSRQLMQVFYLNHKMVQHILLTKTKT